MVVTNWVSVQRFVERPQTDSCLVNAMSCLHLLNLESPMLRKVWGAVCDPSDGFVPFRRKKNQKCHPNYLFKIVVDSIVIHGCLVKRCFTDDPVPPALGSPPSRCHCLGLLHHHKGVSHHGGSDRSCFCSISFGN